MIMEYRFRGYDVMGRKGWVYGDLTHNKKVLKVNPYLIDRVMVGGYEVYPESVGMASGMLDESGREVFVGDIVRWSKDDKKYVVKFWMGMFYASVEWFNKGIYGGFPLWVLCVEEQPCRIEGNVFENSFNNK